MTESMLLLVLNLAGVFFFGLNGSLIALRQTSLDLVGVVVVGMVTALGGGTIRDVLINSLPPATFADWRYLAVAAAGALIAFLVGHHLERFISVIDVADAIGLSLFCVAGADKAMAFGLGLSQSVILGAITAVGGGMIRDVIIRQVPTVLTKGLYAVPAIVGSILTVASIRLGIYGTSAIVIAALSCFIIRILGMYFNLNAPKPPFRDKTQ